MSPGLSAFLQERELGMSGQEKADTLATASSVSNEVICLWPRSLMSSATMHGSVVG